MVAILTRIFGIEHLNLAEDVVQEALVRALQTWPFYGVPKNPSAWIMRASRNLALDVVRRRKVFQNKQAEIIRLMDRNGTTPGEAIFSEDETSAEATMTRPSNGKAGTRLRCTATDARTPIASCVR